MQNDYEISLIEDFSEAAGLSVESIHERVLTAEQLSERFKVSTKTITRWRQHGLVGRRLRIDGRHRIGFLESSVERFAERNQDRIERGSRFRHLTDAERVCIVQQARQMSEAGDGLNTVVERLATTFARSRGTIRGAIAVRGPKAPRHSREGGNPEREPAGVKLENRRSQGWQLP